MKVVFLARWYPHKYDPMFGLFVQRHAEAAARYHDITVVYVHPDEQAQQRYEIDRHMENQVDTLRIYYKKGGRLTNALRYFKACRMGLKLAGHPDLIHVHVLTRMGLVALHEKKWHGIPYLITEHWSRYLPGNGYGGMLREWATRRVVRHAAMVTTVTENLAQAMRAHHLNNPNYVTLPNVVDINLFKPQPHHNAIPKIIHISCFEDQSKNISGLLEALKLMKAKGVTFEAMLIGEGMDLEAMKTKASLLQLDDCVHFTGLLQGEALVNALASGDFLVLSSHYENLPVVLLEALACGLPVVSTQVGGIAELIDETNGLLVPKGDSQALAAAMERCCATYPQYDPETLRSRVVERYGYESVGKLLDAWYRNIVSAPRQ